MRAITAPKSIFNVCSEIKKESLTLGLVPTMGALHEGHISLIKQSLTENDRTVVSIFVNPLQFNKEEDFDKYPRTLERDLAILEELGVDYLFHPGEKEFYEVSPEVRISFGEMEDVLEGKYRPGHFEGVGVVVCKLFNLINPDRAYFGLKDLQQYLLIKRMTLDLGFPIEIVGVETVREPSGLAMSSRNLRLSDEGKEIAANIHKGLKKASRLILEGQELSDVKEQINSFYQELPEIEVEYIEFINGVDLQPIDDLNELSELAVCFAGYVEGIRLIDNLYLRLNS